MNNNRSVTRFVIAGCSRSGTTYMAKLMSELGFPCGHERIFNIWRICNIENFSDPMTAFRDPDAKQGDASFLSIPYLDQLPAGTVVLHQIRNPLKVIQSHMGIRFFADPYVPSMNLAEEHPQILNFIRVHCAKIMEADTEIGRCMRYWYLWNRFAERARHNPSLIYMQYRVEDIDIALLGNIIQKIAPDFRTDKYPEVLQSISKRTNTRARDDSWTLNRLPSGKDKDQVIETARSYGYQALE
jgi:hypothetical protein